MKTNAWLLLSVLILGACATTRTVPVAVTCPPPAPAPSVLTSPVSTAPPLNLRFEDSLRKFEDSLTKAQRQP